MNPAANHLTDAKQDWRRALDGGPLTNANRGGKAKAKKRPISPAKGAASASSQAPPKYIRGTQYSKDKDGPVPWPPARLVRRCRLGWHPPGSANKLCDHPNCREIAKTVDAAKSSWDSTPAKSPRAQAMPPPPPRSGSSAGTSSRAPSPAPSDASSTTSTVTGSSRGTATKMFCKDCYDASNSRPMNFHAECFNDWHGTELCPTC